MTSAIQSDTRVTTLDGSSETTKLLDALHTFLDEVEEVPPKETLDLFLEALLVRMADRRATDEAIFAAGQETASLDDAVDCYFDSNRPDRLLESVYSVLDRADIREQMAGLTCTVHEMLNHVGGQLVSAICSHCCGVGEEHHRCAREAEESMAGPTP